MNKGISTPIVITIIIVLIAVLVGGFFAWRFLSEEEKAKISEKEKEIRPSEEEMIETEEKREQMEEITKEEKEEPYIKAISPNGGERWQIEKIYNIVWESEGVDKVDIWLVDYIGEVVKAKIASNIEASHGKYSWTIPLKSPIGNDFKIQINQSAGEKVTKVDVSDDYFAIINPAITANWETYRNQKYGFEIKHPKDVEINEQDDRISIWLPVSYGFLEKFAVIVFDKNIIEEGLAEFDVITEKKSRIVYLRDINFNKESGIGSVEGVFDDYYVIYSTTKGGQYFGLIFNVLVGSHEYTGIPTTGFNPYSEFHTFDYMISSFRFLDQK